MRGSKSSCRSVQSRQMVWIQRTIDRHIVVFTCISCVGDILALLVLVTRRTSDFFLKNVWYVVCRVHIYQPRQNTAVDFIHCCVNPTYFFQRQEKERERDHSPIDCFCQCGMWHSERQGWTVRSVVESSRERL